MARYAVRSEPVRYRFEGEQISACLYRPQVPNPQPGLLLIQEGWELDNQAKGVAERLAHVGYVTLAVDRTPASSGASPRGAYPPRQRGTQSVGQAVRGERSPRVIRARQNRARQLRGCARGRL